MMRRVVDTNVPMVANGRRGIGAGGQKPFPECRIAAVKFLKDILKDGRVVLDLGGEIQKEYHRHLHPSGEPGVGDRFYKEVLTSSPQRVDRVDLPRREDGEYIDLPQAIIDDGFDPNDRKFAALAHKEAIPAVVAVDRDWVQHRQVLLQNDIEIEFLCGHVMRVWFEP